MSDDTRKVRRKLSTLTNSLDALESGLAPLLSQSLPEIILGLDTIQQAKLQVVIPYLVYDLVFVYLKTRGLDPKTHPVIAELDRVRQYFDKIKDAEDPAKRQLAIDKVAASRFIKHAIAQAKDTTPSKVSGPATHTRSKDNDDNDDNNNNDTGAAARDVRAPVKMTEKMLEREKYLQALREKAMASDDDDDDDDDGDLEVIDGEENDEPSDEPEAGKTPFEEDGSPPMPRASEFDAASKGKGQNKGKGKAKAIADGTPTPILDDPPPSETTAGKRRRPPMDPFAGYGDSPDTPSSAAPVDTGTPMKKSRSGTKVRGNHMDDFGAEATKAPSGEEHQDGAKRPRKRTKKKAVP